MEVEEAEDPEDVEDEDSVAESRLARKVASLAMVSGDYYTPGRIPSESRGKLPSGRNSHGTMAERSDLAVGKHYATIDETVRKFIEAQPVFFVGSAPLSADGHVNVSPKGLDTLRVLGPRTIAYLDLTGSGIETVSHVKENGRVVLMFCAFQGPPRIIRLYGRGTVIEPQDHPFAELAAHFPEFEGTRSIIVVEVSRIADSCGYSVPLLRYEGERKQLTAWANKLGPEGLKIYRREKNQKSIDELSGLK